MKFLSLSTNRLGFGGRGELAGFDQETLQRQQGFPELARRGCLFLISEQSCAPDNGSGKYFMKNEKQELKKATVPTGP